ncbi:hypothetical protein [Saccharothrix syringae]|uniref:Uncharacterized protein n=1 Tax=Saccharothrix syringae TaxID=103733 RepID=A0A5Q0H7V9_SACSY|nr:hypothetical protein [Saccharothrix syringae]QFZ21920.1 hypothetical protein EKG83_34980 [Saccharothrix syringae]
MVGQQPPAQVRRAFYGIAEIAEALGLSRQLVTVWRRRRSHAMPEPDAELSSGPIWRGETVEPWIDRVRHRAGGDGARPLTAATARRACRRVLRLAALVLEEPVRPHLLAKAAAEVRELLPLVAASEPDALGGAVRALLAPLEGGDDDLRERVLRALDGVREVVRLSADDPAGDLEVTPGAG